MKKLIISIFVLFVMSLNILHATTLYICLAGGPAHCKECEDGSIENHPLPYSILDKIENPKDSIQMQNIFSALPKFQKVSKKDLEFFEDFALILIYCDNSDEVLFAARISFMHKGEVIILNPKRWKKSAENANCFMQGAIDNASNEDDIYFYLGDNDQYKNFIKSILKNIAANPIIKEEFEHRNSFYTKQLKRPPAFGYFFENFDYWKKLTQEN